MTLRFSSSLRIFLFLFAAAATVVGSSSLAHADSGAQMDVWWPTRDAVITGTQPLKAMIPGTDVSRYSMYWSVDGGQKNQMYTSYEGYQHKEAIIDLAGWTWRGYGPYVITFSAYDSAGTLFSTKDVPIKTGTQTQQTTTAPTTSTQSAPVVKTVTPAPSLQTAQPAPAPAQSTPTQPTTQTPVTTVVATGEKLYVDPNAPATKQAASWLGSRPADAAVMQKLGAQPTAAWLGGWNSNVQSDANAIVTKAAGAGSTPTLVLYNIPHRDCGSYSAGGTTADKYRDWVRAVANGIGDRSAIVILEPDALAGIDCLSSELKNERQTLLKDAISILKSKPKTKVYLDAGNAKWIGADEMAKRLLSANIGSANGFSLNVSNFMTTADNTAYGTTISSKVGGKHFVIDTSRNGNGPTGDYQWCNPAGRAVGQKPTTSTGNPLVDAYLWLKVPGESDGACNGGPNAGVWWAEYGLALGKNARW